MDTLELTQAAGNEAQKANAPTVERENTSPKVDILQLVFYGMVLVAVAAASIAIAWPDAVGESGSIMLISMAASGLVFLLWILRGAGRRLGMFPERGAAAAAINAATPRFRWIEALDEAVLVSERGGAPVAANTAYSDLVGLALGPTSLDTSGRPVSVDRIFGSAPGLAAPVFRLSKAAKAGEARREILPPVTMGPDALPMQYEINVSPLPRGQMLWRLRRIAGEQEATGAADLKSLYVEDAPMGFFAAKPDGTITYANGWLRELIGLPESAKGIRIDDIMRPEFVKLLRKDKKTGTAGRADIRIRGRDGVEVPVQTITTWSGKGADASGRTIVIASNAKLSSKEGRMSAVSASRPPRADGDPMFDDAPFGSVRLDGDSVAGAIIMDTNRALMEMAQDRASPGNRFADMFVAEDGRDALEAKLLDAIDKPVGLKLVGEDTRHVNVFVTLDADGNPTVAYVIDITEQKELELRLAQGEKMQAIGQLAGSVAHEFNNVLTGIILNTDTLITRHPLGDPSFDELKKINEYSKRCAELVRMLLAYGRKQTFKREVINVSDFLSEFSVLLLPLVDERIDVDIHHGRDLPRIRADKHQIETAIINLAVNARDAMLSHKNSGKLIIRTSAATGADAHADGFNFVENGDYVLIEVEDNGHGMTKEVMDNIFEPFFTTKDLGEGTGLGLATVYGIVKQSGGYICPVSSVGKGTTFKLFLPALDPAELPQETKPEDKEKSAPRLVDVSGRGRILLVEDEDGVRGIAATLLESRGYEVEQASDGEIALDIIKNDETGFDLIISDVVMPGKDGPTLIKEAREYLGDARVVFISGYAERDLAEALDEDREISFLPKPFTVRQLAERVKDVIGQRKENVNAAA